MSKEIFVSNAHIMSLPMSGSSWTAMKSYADKAPMTPDLSDQEDPENVRVLARALVFARTGTASYRTKVIDACTKAIGTESGGRTLAFGRELAAYVISADLVGLPATLDTKFRSWIKAGLTKVLDSKTLMSTMEKRPNNWGTHATCSVVAVAKYLGDDAVFQRAATVFQGYLGNRSLYKSFVYGELSWQSSPSAPVGINPAGATKAGHNVDGVMPDDQRRSGTFRWPPIKENYAWEALQGSIGAAIMFHQSGLDVWNWSNKALLRAVTWLHEQCNFPAEGDDSPSPWAINRFYGSHFPTVRPSRPGKNLGYYDWLFG